ncbi:MAG: GAF domain-containing protein, partial [Chloroflexota bacterium]
GVAGTGISNCGPALALECDITNRESVQKMFEQVVLAYGGVQHSIAHGFQQEDAKLLQSIANQVAVALRNTRIFSEVETALAQAQNTQELYQEQSWQQNRSKEQKGVYHYQQPTAPELDQPILTEAKRLALSQNKPTVVSFDDGHNDTDKSNNGQSIIAPIKLRNRAIGALQLHADDQNWSESDLALIEAVMDQMGQTAETLRLFDETRQRASQEQTIREITEKLRAAPNLDALLEIAARELGQRLGVRHTVIELGIDQSEALPTNGTNGHGK